MKTNIRKYYYHFKHRYLTMNAVVVAIAFIVALGWAWGSIEMMQRNYKLQKEVDTKRRELKLAELQLLTLKFEGNYFRSTEYKELAVRERLGKGDPGEKALILPSNSQKAADPPSRQVNGQSGDMAPSPFQQWMNFLFGGSSRSL